MAGSAFFTTQIQSAYQRNRNSRSKTKNLRCFPCCSVPGKHMPNGFCGQSVEVVIPSSKIGPTHGICAYARFMPQETVTTVDALPAIELDEGTQVRSKNNSSCEWIRVRVGLQCNGNIAFTINPDLLGWHYGWRSNKNTRNTLHVLRLYVFRKSPPPGSQLTLIFELNSNAFVMYSGNNKLDNVSLVHTKRKIEDAQLLKGWLMSSSSSSSSKASRSKVLCTATNVGADALSLPSSVETSGEDRFCLRRLLKEAIDAAKFKSFRPRQLSPVGPIQPGNQFVPNLESEQAGTLQLFEMLLQGDDGMIAAGPSGLGGSASDWPVDKRVNQVLRTITSSKLSGEVASFLYECTTGPVGSTLCETLRAMDMPTTNPFFAGFARALFRRFQRVIARRLEYDLFEAGFLSDCQLRESYGDTSADSLGDVDSDKYIIFESQDAKTLARFVDLLKIYSTLPNLEPPPYSEAMTNPYALVNRTWKDVAQGMLHWFVDVMAGELGACDPYTGYILGRAHHIRKMHATRHRFISIGSPILTFTGHLDMVADNRVRVLNQQSPPLMEYIELIKRTYVYRHKVNAEGFVQQFTFINITPSPPLINFVFTEGAVQRHAPNELQMTKKMLILPRSEVECPRLGDDAQDLLERIKAHPNPPFSPTTQARELQFVWVSEG